ncbi:MAG: hypothetical protein AB9861_20315 [Methanosarcina sp.]|jgi:hypothetical protein
MKAMILRVGIDKSGSCCGTYAPIFSDGSFEYIPIPEGYPSTEEKTYGNTNGKAKRNKKTPLSTFVPPKYEEIKLHYDPEFETCTYGDPTGAPKTTAMRDLEKGDILAFSAGLKPYETDNYEEGIYLIGYFTVDKIVDFMNMTKKEMCEAYNKYENNSHCKRKGVENTLLIVAGDKKKSKILDKAILISQMEKDTSDRRLRVVSEEMQKMLGIDGSLQRGIRRIEKESNAVKFRDFLYSSI